jgi:lipopolysaccharide transport system permease protein
LNIHQQDEERTTLPPSPTPATTEKAPVPTLIIRPPKKWVPVDFHELWEYRELLYSFVARDVKVRYKQTALGSLRAIIQLLFMMVIFTLFFGGFLKIPSDGIPCPLFNSLQNFQQYA